MMTFIRSSMIVMWILGGVAACASSPTMTANVSTINSVRFVSDSDVVIGAEYLSDETVVLSFTDGSTQTLSRAMSGSGARYVDGDYVWWEHQGEATYSLGDKALFIGKIKP
jgi:membrane-bound inhibitor of C-type lysozyme